MLSFTSADDCFRDIATGAILNLDRSYENEACGILISNWWECQCSPRVLHNSASKAQCSKCNALANASPEATLSKYLKQEHPEFRGDAFKSILEPQINRWKTSNEELQ